MSNCNYNPVPPRVWSRVQNPCTYTDASGNSNINYQQVFIPLTGQVVPQGQANYEAQQFYKGNILQYKANSARFTKAQKYSQLAKMCGPNRTKVFATQSETYTNPNTTGLLRVNYNTYPYPNEIVGAPNNISGPFVYNIQNPNDCSGNSIQDGGTLVCGTYANPCTGEIIQQAPTTSTICNSASASNVPGSSTLCWNNKIQTFFPKSRYVMNNSTSKWPEGYKGFVSAVSPNPPVLISAEGSCSSVTLSWSYISNPCMPITNFNIYKNDKFILTVPYTTTTINVNNLKLNTVYSFYVTSSINTVAESIPSNTLSATTLNIFPPQNLSGTSGCGSVTLTWDYPTSTPCSITDYKIYYGDGTYITTVPYTGDSSVSITINGLDYNTTYSFYVTSYNSSSANYQSIPSNTVSVITQNLLPPQNLSGTSGCGSVTLTWSAPSSTTCSITDYQIYVDGTYITSVPYTGDSSVSITINGLDYNTTYSFYVTSYNSSNANHQSTPSNVCPLTTTPLLPPELSGNSGCGSVTLTWTAPSSTTCITDYQIYYEDGTYITSVPYTELSLTINGLDYNTQYSFYVTSYNSNTNNQSTPSNVFPLTTTPLYPPDDLSGNISSQSITLTWNAPSSTTCITDYKIYYGDGTYISSVSYPATSYIVSDLSFNTQYSFYVTSYNSNTNNQSTESTIFTATTINFTATGNYTVYNNNSFTGIVFDASSVSQSLTMLYPQLVTLIVIGGGGGGTGGHYYSTTSYELNPAGGGGGGITYIQNLYLEPAYYTINVGSGGGGGSYGGGGSDGGYSNFDSYTSYGGGGGGDYGGLGGGVNTVNGGGGGMGTCSNNDIGTTIINNIISGTNSNAGNQGSIITSSFSPGGNSFYANNSIPIFVPFITLNSTIPVGGGGGGGGGGAGQGIGGLSGASSTINGENGYNSITSGYGGGGGGGGASGSFPDETYGNGGNGGNGAVIVYWPPYSTSYINTNNFIGNYVIYNNYGYIGYVFNYGSGSITFNENISNVNMVLCGGGGAGSDAYDSININGGGGGGGGGTTYYQNLSFNAGQQVSNISVGGGGTYNSINGSDTTFGTYTATGGGGSYSTNCNGGSGGNGNGIGGGGGGGGGGYTSSGDSTGGSGGGGSYSGSTGETSGFGSSGGNSYIYHDSSGISMPFLPAPTTIQFGGGGQSATQNGFTESGGNSGLGLGGNGGGTTQYFFGGNGINNINQGFGGGGGGSGGSCTTIGSSGGSGGNGVIILWWPTT